MTSPCKVLPFRPRPAVLTRGDKVTVDGKPGTICGFHHQRPEALVYVEGELHGIPFANLDPARAENFA